MSLTAAQRQKTLRIVADLSGMLGMPEAVYVAEHGVTILANAICARRWAAYGPLTLDTATQVPVLVTEVVPIDTAVA